MAGSRLRRLALFVLVVTVVFEMVAI